ncbi:MAG: hypothetical protein ISS77_02255 [Phycisphaerae bacterium]|nr:hypothetical protein [Phycisphaerae bacterium]
MIPKNIKSDHIKCAIDEIHKEGVPLNRHSRKFDLFFKGEPYPPKYVISVANKFANGYKLDAKKFSAGQETNSFLKRLGFQIVNKTKEA